MCFRKNRNERGGALVVILATQLGVWTAVTHQMPGRFLVAALVPICRAMSSGGRSGFVECLPIPDDIQ